MQLIMLIAPGLVCYHKKNQICCKSYNQCILRNYDKKEWVIPFTGNGMLPDNL